jgi:hypothetical protein
MYLDFSQLLVKQMKEYIEGLSLNVNVYAGTLLKFQRVCSDLKRRSLVGVRVKQRPRELMVGMEPQHTTLGGQ